MSKAECKSGIWSVCSCDGNLNVTTYGKFTSEEDAREFCAYLGVDGAYVMLGCVVW